MPPRRRSKKPRRRAKRPLLAGPRKLAARARDFQLEPHHVDILALAVIALGVFLGGVAYVHWAGGALGNGLVQAARFLFGALGYAVPAALVLIGALVLLRDLRPPARPLRTGGLCLLAALTLALAAGTLGLGPGRAPADAFWQPAVFKARGGIVGEGELWATAHLISTLGAQILSVFLLLAGLILVTGATVAGVLRATGTTVAGTGRALKRSTGGLAGAVRGPAGGRAAAASYTASSGPAGGRAPQSFEPLRPPEPEEAELIVRATHIEAPPIEPADAGEDEQLAEDELASAVGAAEHEHELEPVARRPSEQLALEPEHLTPQGRYRGSITDDPEFVWRVPGARFLTRSTGEAAKPDTAGQEQVASTLVEALGHFGIEAKVIGRVTGPTSRATSCGWHPAPRSRRSRSSRTTSRTRSRRPTSASSRRSRASRRSASRCPTRAGGSCTSATSSRSRRRLVAADGVARQGHRRPRDRRRPREDAAPARRRHDRRGQVGVRERDAVLDPAAGDAARGAARAGRPQAGRAQPLRGRSRTC